MIKKKKAHFFFLAQAAVFQFNEYLLDIYFVKSVDPGLIEGDKDEQDTALPLTKKEERRWVYRQS